MLPTFKNDAEVHQCLGFLLKKDPIVAKVQQQNQISAMQIKNGGKKRKAEGDEDEEEEDWGQGQHLLFSMGIFY